jgi:hypothetical protein
MSPSSEGGPTVGKVVPVASETIRSLQTLATMAYPSKETMMFTFKKIHDEEGFVSESIELKIDEVCLDELYDAFDRFLIACGFRPDHIRDCDKYREEASSRCSDGGDCWCNKQKEGVDLYKEDKKC